VPYNFMFFVHGDHKHIMQKADEDLWNTIQKIYSVIEVKGLDSIEVMKELFSEWEKKIGS